MAKITIDDVSYVAGLARLSFSNEAKAKMAKELEDVLCYMEKLNEVDTSDVEPMMHVLDVSNVFREDVVGESLSREEAFRNAPNTDGEYFLVPRILDND